MRFPLCSLSRDEFRICMEKYLGCVARFDKARDRTVAGSLNRVIIWPPIPSFAEPRRLVVVPIRWSRCASVANRNWARYPSILPMTLDREPRRPISIGNVADRPHCAEEMGRMPSIGELGNSVTTADALSFRRAAELANTSDAD